MAYDRAVPVGRWLDLLPQPSLRVQRVVAATVILTQGGIAVTGAIVRVTASGLGCPTWPQCFPGSFTPVAVAEVPRVHQAVEFGNRMISIAVVITAALAVLTVTRARRRAEVLVYAWLMPLSTVVQAVIGGITVRTGLLWWTVAIHLLASMTMVWLSVLLYVKVGEPDDGTVRPLVAKPLRALTALSAVNLAAVLVTGTLVTAAGPHAGDRSPSRTVPRLKVEITTLVHMHSSLLIAYGALLVGLGCGLLAVGAARGDHGAPRCAAGPGLRAGRRRDHAILHRGARRAGRRPRGRRCGVHGGHSALWASMRARCENGPSPSRSKADSTASANSRWARLRVSASSRRQPSDGSTSCSSTKRAPLRCARAYSNSLGAGAAAASAAAPTSQSSKSGSGGNACDGLPPRKISTVSAAESAGCTNTLRFACGDVGGGRGPVAESPGAGADGRADEHVTAARQPSSLARRDDLAGHRRHPPIRQVGQVAPVGVPGDDGGRIQQVGHAGGPGQELVEPIGVIVGGPQYHQVRAADLGIVPRQPTRVQTAVSQGGDQTGIVAVTTGVPRAPRQHDAGMEDVRPGKLHARA